MKKNRMMRLASVLLVLTLLSTSVISGTFAKYVTSDTASDTARVAKFGVVVTASGSLFSDAYLKATDNTPAPAWSSSYSGDNISVAAESADTKVVAPGTKSSDTGLTFSITGKPEVAVKLDVTADVTEQVFLKQNGALPKMTTGYTGDTFNNTTDYYPVKFTLKQKKASAGAWNVLVDGGSLLDVKAKLEDLSQTVIDANTDLAEQDYGGIYQLTWKWDFDASGAGTNDDQDTLLGDLAAGTSLTPTTTLADGTDYNLEAAISIAVTVTQVD